MSTEPTLREAGRLALAAGLLAALFTAIALRVRRQPAASTKPVYGGDIGYDDALGI